MRELEDRLERERIQRESDQREMVDPGYKAWMDYKRFEEMKKDELDKRKQQRQFRVNNPNIVYEHMRYIHLPANFTLACLKEEDWRVLGNRMSPQDFDSLSKKLATIDHYLEANIIDPPEFCCPKPLA